MPHQFKLSNRSSLLSKHLLLFLITGLLLAVTPFTVMATGQYVEIDGYNPGPGFDPNDVTIDVGDIVHWQHIDLVGAAHNIVPGDYEGRPCYDTTFIGPYYFDNHEAFLNHQFPAPGGDCYYRCTNVPGMQGVVHVLGSGGNQPPTAVSLTPMNIITVPGVAQNFSVLYTDPNGYQTITDASIHITDLGGTLHNEWAHYNPQTNSFTLQGAVGSCSPGGSGSLSSGSVALSCANSSASGSYNNLTVVFNLTPQASFSGPINSMFITVTDQSSANNGKVGGYWIVDRPPSANTIMPANNSTPVNNSLTFTATYSDPDGYQNISDAGLYFAAGANNEWIHYSPTANNFSLAGVSGSCTPGQSMTLSTPSLRLNCAASSANGSGANLTVNFNVTPLAPAAGRQYLQVPATIDSAGKSDGKILGTWTVLSF